MYSKHTKRTFVLLKSRNNRTWDESFFRVAYAPGTINVHLTSLHHPFKYLLRVKINLKVPKSIKCIKLH